MSNDWWICPKCNYPTNVSLIDHICVKGRSLPVDMLPPPDFCECDVGWWVCSCNHAAFHCGKCGKPLSQNQLRQVSLFPPKVLWLDV